MIDAGEHELERASLSPNDEIVESSLSRKRTFRFVPES
jgi:hypothetical protein